MSRAQIEVLHVRNAHAQTCAVWSEYVLFVFPFVYLFLFVWLKVVIITNLGQRQKSA